MSSHWSGRINHLLDGMANAHEHVWSAEGVAGSEEWADIRAAASEALAALGWSEGEPRSYHEDYVRQ